MSKLKEILALRHQVIKWAFGNRKPHVWHIEYFGLKLQVKCRVDHAYWGTPALGITTLRITHVYTLCEAQAVWLLQRLPDLKYTDVELYVKDRSVTFDPMMKVYRQPTIVNSNICRHELRDLKERLEAELSYHDQMYLRQLGIESLNPQ